MIILDFYTIWFIIKPDGGILVHLICILIRFMKKHLINLWNIFEIVSIMFKFDINQKTMQFCFSSTWQVDNAGVRSSKTMHAVFKAYVISDWFYIVYLNW